MVVDVYDSAISAMISATQLRKACKRDFAMVVVTNSGGKKAEKALFALAPALYAQFARTK